MSYSLLKKIAIISLIGYFGIAGALKIADPVRERYPFFSWFFFSEIPNHEHGYTIRLLSYGEESYTEPLPFSQMKFLFRSLGQAPTVYTPIIEKLGESVKTNNAQVILENRDKLESIFKKSARYEVLEVWYDPLEYWHTGTYQEATTLATFFTEKP